LDVRTLRRIEIRSRARFILHTDVNRFYPSIFTHSIPWAIHTKLVVKAAKAAGRAALAGLWANRLDELARNLNEQQTMGVPIGPATHNRPLIRAPGVVAILFTGQALPLIRLWFWGSRTSREISAQK
jgi:hypothetical protein